MEIVASSHLCKTTCTNLCREESKETSTAYRGKWGIEERHLVENIPEHGVYTDNLRAEEYLRKSPLGSLFLYFVIHCKKSSEMHKARVKQIWGSRRILLTQERKDLGSKESDQYWNSSNHLI
jgi:hypothetical protein